MNDLTPIDPPGPDADDENDSVERISEYLEAGRVPYDPSIEEDPEARAILRSLIRLRSLSGELIEADAASLPAPDDSWLKGVLGAVTREARSGRDIPFSSTEPGDRFLITEGAVRGLIRDAGDSVEGVLVGRCSIEGDVTDPGAEVTISLTATVLYGISIADSAEHVRAAVHSALLRHTELTVVSIDVEITDVFIARAPKADTEGAPS